MIAATMAGTHQCPITATTNTIHEIAVTTMLPISIRM
jgi:hypothetical protein